MSAICSKCEGELAWDGTCNGCALDAARAENARLRERAEALAGALTRIAEGDAEIYLSCPGVPICSRTHDDNCAVGVAAAALRAYRECDNG